MEKRYFKADGSMEKKWDTVIPADLKRLFVSGICPTGHKRVKTHIPRNVCYRCCHTRASFMKPDTFIEC